MNIYTIKVTQIHLIEIEATNVSEAIEKETETVLNDKSYFATEYKIIGRKEMHNENN